jgi:hypothetical protein
MKLICEVNEELKVISEASEKGGKNLYIEGVFMQGGVKNKNGRVYPVETLAREVARYKQNYIDQKRAYGELGHPSGPTINLERVSHMITDLRREGDNFIGRAKIMDTPYGNIVKNLMGEGARLGVSSRGMGTLKDKAGVMEVQDDFYLATAADIVADPSAPQAFVEGIMEGKEWVWENGVIREVELEQTKTTINEAASRRNTEEAVLEAFQKLLGKF